jgi:hypothetical protein
MIVEEVSSMVVTEQAKEVFAKLLAEMIAKHSEEDASDLPVADAE